MLASADRSRNGGAKLAEQTAQLADSFRTEVPQGEYAKIEIKFQNPIRFAAPNAAGRPVLPKSEDSRAPVRLNAFFPMRPEDAERFGNPEKMPYHCNNKSRLRLLWTTTATASSWPAGSEAGSGRSAAARCPNSFSTCWEQAKASSGTPTSASPKSSRPKIFWSSPTAAISRWYWNTSPKSTKIRFSRNRSDAIRHPVSLMQPGGSAWPPPTRR